MTIVLRSGPLHSLTDSNISDDCQVYRFVREGTLLRYRNSGDDDARGYRIFIYSPLIDGEAETARRVHDG